MTSFWNNRKILLADIRSGRNLAKIKARGKKSENVPSATSIYQRKN